MPRPPSTRSTCPVMYLLSGRHRNSTASAISSGSPIRPSGTVRRRGREARTGFLRAREGKRHYQHGGTPERTGKLRLFDELLVRAAHARNDDRPPADAAHERSHLLLVFIQRQRVKLPVAAAGDDHRVLCRFVHWQAWFEITVTRSPISGFRLHAERSRLPWQAGMTESPVSS